MSNRIITRHGTKEPVQGDLLPNELGIFNDEGKLKLYVGKADAAPQALDTSDYTQLTSLPSINMVPLSGNKTSADLGLAAAVHSHAESDVTNLTTDLSAKANKNGDTFTGDVTFSSKATFNNAMLVNNDASYPGILFAPTETAEWRAGLHLDGRHNSSYKRNRLYLNQRSFSSSTYGFGDYYEQYLFPTVEMDLTENKSYNILTEKSFKSLFSGTAAVGDTINLPDVFDYKLLVCRLKASGGSVSGTFIPMMRVTRSTTGTNYLRGMCATNATQFEEVTFSAANGSTTFTVQSANRTTVSSGANVEYVVADIWGVI